jgi:hypothetical protein
MHHHRRMPNYCHSAWSLRKQSQPTELLFAAWFQFGMDQAAVWPRVWQVPLQQVPLWQDVKRDFCNALTHLVRSRIRLHSVENADVIALCGQAVQPKIRVSRSNFAL